MIFEIRPHPKRQIVATLHGSMESGKPMVGFAMDTVSSLPGGRNCSAAITGESLVRELDSRIGRATASVLQTGRLCMHQKSMHG